MDNLISERLVAQAKAGEPQAIAALINQDLRVRGIQARIERQGDYLQIVLEAQRSLNQEPLIEFIQQGMIKLSPTGISILRVYGHKAGDPLPLWMQQLALQPRSLAVSSVTTGHLPKSKKKYTRLEAQEFLSQYAQGKRDFSGVDLSEADLPGAKLGLINLHQANLAWANLSGASLSHTDLSQAKLNYTSLYKANLQGANLSGANLEGADLRGANLSWAQLQGANLTAASLTGANLQETQFLRVIMPDGTLLD